jgi:hypothetical protein
MHRLHYQSVYPQGESAMKREIYSVLVVIASFLVFAGPTVAGNYVDGDGSAVNVSLNSATNVNGNGTHTLGATNSGDQVRLLSENQLRLAQRRQCSQRSQVFATQDRAWQRWREAQSQGYAVSNGVVPCYDEFGTRGYCFYVFFPC